MNFVTNRIHLNYKEARFLAKAVLLMKGVVPQSHEAVESMFSLY